MKNKENKEKGKNPICIGAGLVALDLVMNGDPAIPLKIFAGGSCGNVTTILSFLKWESYPVARLKNNLAAKELLLDLASVHVKTTLITRTEDGSTPIIIQRIKKDKNGDPIHKFEFRNPNDGKWLPGYKPVLGSHVNSLINKVSTPAVFYFDRINRASIDFARYFKSKNALIYFEPSSIGEMRLFEQCLAVADIIKFSSDRINNYSALFPKQQVPLEIETLGKDGVKFRYSQKLDSTEWETISSYDVNYVLDAAGAGDWMSAGIISKIGTRGLAGFKTVKRGAILNAIKYGQALGALNCFFVGARGLMYNLTPTQIGELVKKIQKTKIPLTIIKSKEPVEKRRQIDINSLC